jgi:myo-inositol 2-dehydrogenase / D-chiro-inositol 1-dehydrogenase
MTAVFRLGLIGAGRMGRTHLSALAGSELVHVTAIAEPSQQAREALAGGDRPVHQSVAELLDSSKLDGVLIAAPSDLHEQIIAEVAAHGVPILCEKPCGVTSAQAAAAAAIAASAGVPLQIAYWRRYVPALQSLHARIASGEMGAVHLVSCYQWDESPPSAAFRAHSGGIFIDQGVHEFDQLRWLTGQEIGPLTTAASTLVSDPQVHGDVDSAQLIAELSGGAVGFVSLGRHHPGGDICRAEVFGTAAAQRCDFLSPQDGQQVQFEALRRQAEDFVVLAGGGASAGASAPDAVAALEAAERATATLPALAAS